MSSHNVDKEQHRLRYNLDEVSETVTLNKIGKNIYRADEIKQHGKILVFYSKIYKTNKRRIAIFST